MDETRNLVGNAATKVTAHERNWQMVFRVSFRANRVAPAGHGHAHHRQAEQKRTGTTPLPLLRVHIKIMISLRPSENRKRAEAMDPYARMLTNSRNDTAHGGSTIA